MSEDSKVHADAPAGPEDGVVADSGPAQVQVPAPRPSAKSRLLEVLFSALSNEATDAELAVELLKVACPILEAPENLELLVGCFSGALETMGRFGDNSDVATLCVGVFCALSLRDENAARLMDVVPQLLSVLEKHSANLVVATKCTAIFKRLSWYHCNREKLGVVVTHLMVTMGALMDSPDIVVNCLDCCWNVAEHSANRAQVVTAVLPWLKKATDAHSGSAEVAFRCVGLLRVLAKDEGCALKLAQCIPLVVDVLQRYGKKAWSACVAEHGLGFFWNLSGVRETRKELALAIPCIATSMYGVNTNDAIKALGVGTMSFLSAFPENRNPIMLVVGVFGYANWQHLCKDVAVATNQARLFSNLAGFATKTQLKQLADVAIWHLNYELGVHKADAEFVESCVGALTAFAADYTIRARVKHVALALSAALACHPDNTELSDACADFFKLVGEEQLKRTSEREPEKKHARLA